MAGAVAALLAASGPAASETVTFEVGATDEPALTLSAELSKPEGDGPFAAVVMLHGCNGPWKPWGDDWASRLVGWGYVALEVDSFGPRGYPDGICGRDGAVGELTTAGDAHAAKAHLQSLPFVDPNRIGVMGMSHGGTATLWAVQNTYLVETPRADPFEAAIALYPYCEGTLLYRLDAPLLILTGEMDDWTPSGLCERLSVEGPSDHAMSLEVYAGATHAFDVDLPGRQYLGHTMRFDPEAARDAEERIRRFLAQHLDRGGGPRPPRE